MGAGLGALVDEFIVTHRTILPLARHLANRDTALEIACHRRVTRLACAAGLSARSNESAEKIQHKTKRSYNPEFRQVPIAH